MQENELRQWKTLSKKTILDHSKYLKVESHAIELPDGEVISDWPLVVAPDAIIVVACTPDNEFLCFRQTKYAIDGITMAPVGGLVEPGEDPFAAAKRELLEETGYMALDWTPLGSHVMDPNRYSGMRYLYLAQNASKVAEPDSDDLEDQQLLLLKQSEVETALDAGEFKVLGWTAAIALALRRLSQD